MVQADGIIISSQALTCDVSECTGESDLMEKQDAFQMTGNVQTGFRMPQRFDPFIISGSLVVKGAGSYLVTAVGVHSTHWKFSMWLQEEHELTPLERQLITISQWARKCASL